MAMIDLPFGPVDYTSNNVPEKYRCVVCQVRGVKLWRVYEMFLENQVLYCAECALLNQKKEGPVGDDGKRNVNEIDIPQGHRTDQIGWLVPAIPTKEGDTFWGYTTAPQDACYWWNRIPTRKTGP